MNTLDKKIAGTNLGFIKKCLRILQSWRTHTLGYLDACLRCEPLSSTATIHPSPPSVWLFHPHHSLTHSKPVLDKAALKTWEKPMRKKLVKRSLYRGDKYITTRSVALCVWVVYAVNTGDKPMGHGLLAVHA